MVPRQDDLPSNAREDTSGDRKRRVSQVTRSAGSGDDDDEDIEDSGVTGHTYSKGSPDGHSGNTAKEAQKAANGDPGDTERSTREADREAQRAVKEHDPRKTLMPAVLHRSSMETSFGLDALDSQVSCPDHLN